MRDLDTLYHWYSTDPTKLDALLEDVTRFARAIAKNRGHPSPEDAAQKIAAEVWRAMKDYKSGSFRAWVYTIASRSIVDHFRSQHMQPVLVAAHAEPDEPEWTSYDTSALEPQMRKIVAMLEMGYTQDEIAVKMNCGRRALRNIVQRHIANLTDVARKRALATAEENNFRLFF